MRAAEDVLIQHFLPMGCAGFFSAAGDVLQSLQGAWGGKAVELQPSYPCDESSVVYSQLTAVKFIQELQISVARATAEICQTISPLGIIVTTSKANSETSIICSRSFVYLGKEKYQEVEVFCWLLTKLLMFDWVTRNEEQAFPVSGLYGVVAVQIKTFPPYILVLFFRYFYFQNVLRFMNLY